MYGSKVSFNENPNCTETSQFPGFYMIRVKGVSEKDLSMDLLLNRYQG